MNRVLGWIKDKINNRINDKYFRYVVSYSLLFFLIASIIIGIFAYYNKSFINNGDAFAQHFVTLKYYRNLLINFFETGSITTFTWRLGFGLDMFANLSYYAFGDFFSYFAVLVKESDLVNFYNIVLFFRMWLIGISFIAFSKHKKFKGPGVVIGALMYALSINTLTQGFRNPYMLNASIIFPFMIIAFEKCVIEKKNALFVFVTAVCFLSGFYFAYMMCMVLGIYGIIFIIVNKKDKGIFSIILNTLKVFILAIIGLFISAFIMLPSVMQFINSSRSFGNIGYHFYDEYYRSVVLSFLDTSSYYDNRLGLSSIFLLTVPFFIKRFKNDIPCFITTLFLVTAMFVVELSSALVGFSFPLNRWTFIVCFFFAYITGSVLKSNFKLTSKDINFILLLNGLYFLILFYFDKSFDIQLLCSITVFIICLFLYSSSKFNRKIRLNTLLVPIVVALGIGYTAFYFFIPWGKNGVDSYINSSNFNYYYESNYMKMDGYKDALDFLKEHDKSYYNVLRYPSVFQLDNGSLYYDYNSMSYFYSINSNRYSFLSSDLENSQYMMSYEIRELDYRTKITTLINNKYMVTSNKRYAPYGYKLIYENDDTFVYENKYYLPFGYIYNDYITEEEYRGLNEIERESVLLKTNVIDSKKELSHFTNYKEVVDKDINKINYENKVVTKNYDVEKKKIKVLDINQDYISLKTERQKNMEIYVKVSGLKIKGLDIVDGRGLFLNGNYSPIEISKYNYSKKWYTNELDFRIKISSNGISKNEWFRQKEFTPYYYEDEVALFNLGYFENFNGNIKLSFDNLGIYSYDDIEVFAVNFNSYEKDINFLKKNSFVIDSIENGHILGHVDTKRSGILQFSTIYSDGWSVYVDGKKVETFESNLYFLGIDIDKGEHKIELKYETPYLNEGIKITKLGLYLFVVVLLSDILYFIYKLIVK